ncbi:MAG TPA: hypothetical protein VLB12_15515 [Gemmatimonadales bacterium]|nr:hypothetical protein [Gemmatimonadales bacterium]
MTEEPSKVSVWVARIAVAALAVLCVYGSAKYGFSAEVRRRLWHDLAERPGGPMTFRFILQPIMASIAAIHAGIQDARIGRPGFFWSILHDPERRKRRIGEALRATGQIILLGIVMDTIYQLRVLKTFYPAEAALIAVLLAVVPYFLMRGIAQQIAKRWLSRSTPTRA